MIEKDDFQRKIEKFKKLWELKKREKTEAKKEEEVNYKDLVDRSYKNLKNKENEKFLKLLFEFLKSKDKKNLIIIWPPWIGKTYLLKNLLIQGRKYRIEAFYISEEVFYDEFKNGNLRKRTHQEKICDVRNYIWEIMLKTKVLVLDDIGTIIGTVDITKTFYPKVKSLLDYRLQRWLKSIFITNLEISELQRIFDSRLMDRILESHILVQIKTWTNKRHWWKINLVEL